MEQGITFQSKNKIFQSMNEHLLLDEKPSGYFESLNASKIYTEYPFTTLGRLRETQQSPIHHPEGNVWNHTMLVIDEAAKVKSKSSDSRAFMWAALLHDIGKPDTTRIRKGKITSYEHDKLGAKMSKEFLEQFKSNVENNVDDKFIEKVAALVRWHMQILFVVKSLPFADINRMKEQAPVCDIALLGLCDRLGRTGANREEEEENIRIFLEKTQNVCKVNQ